LILGNYKFAVITQGIAARIARNQASSAEAINFARLFRPLMFRGLQIIDECDDLTSKSKL